MGNITWPRPAHEAMNSTSESNDVASFIISFVYSSEPGLKPWRCNAWSVVLIPRMVIMISLGVEHSRFCDSLVPFLLESPIHQDSSVSIPHSYVQGKMHLLEVQR